MCFFGSKKSFERLSALGADSDHGYSSWSLNPPWNYHKNKRDQQIEERQFRIFIHTWSVIIHHKKSMSQWNPYVMEKLPSLRSKSAKLSIKFPSNSNAEVSYMLCQTWIKGRSLLSCTLAAGIGVPDTFTSRNWDGNPICKHPQATHDSLKDC